MLLNILLEIVRVKIFVCLFLFQYGISSFKCSLSVVYFKLTFNYFYDLSFLSYRVGNKVFTEHYCD